MLNIGQNHGDENRMVTITKETPCIIFTCCSRIEFRSWKITRYTLRKLVKI